MTIKHNLAILNADAYKFSHHALYPKDTEFVYEVLIPRKNMYFKDTKGKPYGNEMVHFGTNITFQLIKEDFQEHFFDYEWSDVEETIIHVLKNTLSTSDIERFKNLHQLGYLPIKVHSLPEGVLVPMGTPVMTIENTLKDFFWLPGFLETYILATYFTTSTASSYAYQYKKLSEKYAKLTCDNNLHVPYQFHNFSMRGNHGVQASNLTGIAHLTSFVGSDTMSAALFAEKYANANLKDGETLASVIASEHSVAEAYGRDNEFEYFKSLIEQNPTGILSLVADTYDYWQVINDFMPKLKDQIMTRNGKVVLRPDSTDTTIPILLTKTVETLWDIFGGTVNKKGYKVLDEHIGVLYGDAFSLEMAKEVFDMLEASGFASSNVVAGIGAYTLSVQVTRDTFSQAIKAQSVIRSGKEMEVFKDPKTAPDKKSLKGRVAVIINEEKKVEVIDSLNLKSFYVDKYNQSIVSKNNTIHYNYLESIFEDGSFDESPITYSLKEIRHLINWQIHEDLNNEDLK